MLRNRSFLLPYMPLQPESDFTIEGVKANITEMAAARAAGTAYPFCIRSGGAIVGRITLSQVFRKAFRNCYLGYFVGEEHNGRGYATEGVRLAVRHAFGELGLHRVQANVMTSNARSARVLEKAGFRKEGVALRYLSIAGRWEDHDMYAITVEDLAGGSI